METLLGTIAFLIGHGQRYPSDGKHIGAASVGPDVILHRLLLGGFFAWAHRHRLLELPYSSPRAGTLIL